MELGIAFVAAITAIAYLIGMAVKATGAADKWIPTICGAAGRGAWRGRMDGRCQGFSGARLAQCGGCRHRIRLGRDRRAPEREAADKTEVAAPTRRGVRASACCCMCGCVL